MTTRRPLRRFRRGRSGALVEALRQMHDRSGGPPLDPSLRTDLERSVECRGARRSRRTLAWAALRMAVVVWWGTLAAQRSARDALAAAELESRTVVVRGRAMTTAEARVVGGTPDGAGGRHLDGDGHLLRLLGHGLLLIDTVALVVVFGFLLNVDWAAPQVVDLVTVLALAVFGAAVQALLAVRLGMRLWVWRHADPDTEDRPEEFPPRSGITLAAAGLLAVLAVFAAVALYVRIEVEAELAEVGVLGTALGLLLACSALAAPWCVVAQEAYRSSPEHLTRAAAATVVRRADARRRRWTSRSRRRLDCAIRRRLRAAALRESARRRCLAHLLGDHEVILRGRGLVDPAVARELGDPSGRTGSLLPPAVETDLRGLDAAIAHLDALLQQARSAHHLLDRSTLDLAA